MAGVWLVVSWAATLLPLAAPATSVPRVLVAEVDGAIHPITAEFMVSAIDHADTTGASALIFVLRTPGGVLDSTRTIVSRLIAARTPVVVYVGPSGARAASAGFLITLAADVAAMAPGTHIGAAHPVSADGREANKTLSDKAASDVAAYARSLAEARGRNAALAEEGVLKSRSFTAREAADATPPLVDLVVGSLEELVTALDGREVVRFNGARATIEATGARRDTLAMTWRQRFLSALAHPQIAYLLFTLGMLGLTVEMWNPGSVAPGVVGGVCLLLAFLAFQVLPIDVTGLLLIGLGIALMVLEIKLPSFGALGVGGIVSLVLGSIVLMGNTPGLRIGWGLSVPVMLAFGAIFLFLGRLAARAQGQMPVTGAAGMLGMEGRVVTAIVPEAGGQVAVRGEIWSARAAQALDVGVRVTVVSLDGLTLMVQPSGDRGPLS
jgi:membrane-bound serine protease (ClpP class)